MEILKKYNLGLSFGEIAVKIAEIKANSKQYYQAEVLKKIFSFIDLTSLNSTDTVSKVRKMVEKVNKFNHVFSDMPNVAAICVYPSLVETVKAKLADPKQGIASVAAGFPSSQTFIAIKTLESAMAVKKGATEVDVVISIGTFLSRDYQTVFDEIKALKKSIGKAHLKVILESGILDDSQKIWDASIIAMEAGADFIKTSTGKMQPAATLEAVYVMSLAINKFYKKTNKKVGLKPAGGISTGSQAIEYYAIVNQLLGEDWLSPGLFRIGASSLANNLLSEIAALDSGSEVAVSYF
ncbi:MAG: deoxyribose-phosphate aldolase [Bacteroidetes bacterium 4572_117]|nr:MAG: deoxyribose-phosphate aldolase [Bacteroidetes bacterium 4572_117]